MAVLCSPRRIRSSDRGKGDRLKCGIRRAFCYVGFMSISIAYKVLADRSVQESRM